MKHIGLHDPSSSYYIALPLSSSLFSLAYTHSKNTIKYKTLNHIYVDIQIYYECISRLSAILTYGYAEQLTGDPMNIGTVGSSLHAVCCMFFKG